MAQNHVLSYFSYWVDQSKNLIDLYKSSWNEDAKIGIGFVSSWNSCRENQPNAFSKKPCIHWCELYFLDRRNWNVKFKYNSVTFSDINIVDVFKCIRFSHVPCNIWWPVLRKSDFWKFSFAKAVSSAWLHKV